MPADCRRRRVLCAGAALTWVGATGVPDARAQGADEPLARIDDLRPLLAAVARERRPLLLFFTTPGCPFCRQVRGGYLRPRERSGVAASGVVIREVEIGSRRRLLDEAGRPATEAELADRFNVRIVPCVLLVDTRLRPLTEPLVGIDRSGFYEGYLQAAIDAALKALAAAS